MQAFRLSSIHTVLMDAKRFIPLSISRIVTHIKESTKNEFTWFALFYKWYPEGDRCPLFFCLASFLLIVGVAIF